MSELALFYHWPHDYWRRIGWFEFRLWLREMRRQVTRVNDDQGRQQWLDQQRAKHERIRNGR